MLIAIFVTLLSVDPLIAVTVFGGFGMIYGVIIRLTRKRLLFNSQVSAREPTQVIKSPQDGLGGIRDVHIDGTQSSIAKFTVPLIFICAWHKVRLPAFFVGSRQAIQIYFPQATENISRHYRTVAVRY